MDTAFNLRALSRRGRCGWAGRRSRPDVRCLSFFFSSRRRHTRCLSDWSSDVCSSDLTFADQVTTVAREVGVEGRLGGQANVPGAAGTWKDMTGNVNLLAANLTTQVRAIAEVATAVTKGDLTRSIQVEARGEVAELKDNINTMIV